MIKRKIGLNYRSVTGTVPSTKVHDTPLHYESTLERDLLIVLDFWPQTIRIETQPSTIRYTDQAGRGRVYTPDIQVLFCDDTHSLFGHRHCLIEVKYQADIESDSATFEERFEAARNWCSQHEMSFVIATENEIRTPLLSNARLIGPHLKLPNLDDQLFEDIQRLVCESQGCSIGSIIENIVGEKPNIRRHVFHMIRIGVLQADYRRDITDRTEVRGIFEDLYRD